MADPKPRLTDAPKAPPAGAAVHVGTTIHKPATETPPPPPEPTDVLGEVEFVKAPTEPAPPPPPTASEAKSIGSEKAEPIAEPAPPPTGSVRVRVKSPVFTGGKLHAAGSVLELSRAEADSLAGSLEKA